MNSVGVAGFRLNPVLARYVRSKLDLPDASKPVVPHWRRNGFTTWLFQPAATGWYPNKATASARPVPGVATHGPADSYWTPTAAGVPGSGRIDQPVACGVGRSTRPVGPLTGWGIGQAVNRRTLSCHRLPTIRCGWPVLAQPGGAAERRRPFGWAGCVASETASSTLRPANSSKYQREHGRARRAVTSVTGHVGHSFTVAAR